MVVGKLVRIEEFQLAGSVLLWLVREKWGSYSVINSLLKFDGILLVGDC